MANFEDLTGKFILSAILLISVFFFIATIQSVNNSTDPLINNNIFNESFGSILATTDSATSSAEEKYDVFNSEEPKSSALSIVLFAIVSVGKAFSQIIMGFFTALIKLPLIVLGIPETVYGLILTWLVLAIIVGAWLLYKLGG